jgi:hypothetical protein
VLTRNLLAGIAVAALLGSVAFFWSAVSRRQALGVAAAFGVIACLFGTEHVMRGVPIPDPSAPLGFQTGSYDCGIVATNVIHRSVAHWDAEQATLISQGMARKGSTSLVDDCRNQMEGGLAGFAITGIAALVLFGVVAAPVVAVSRRPDSVGR